MLSIIPARYLALFSGAIVIMLIFLAFNAGRVTATPVFPSEASADAGFARDMQVHHTQAVEMSMLVLERSSDPNIRSMAYDMALTQQQQNGQMFAWLREWGLPQASRMAPMAWMHSTGHGPHTGVRAPATDPGPMPGLASRDDMDRLRQATGKEADTIFLTPVISHHQAGVAMAEAAVQRPTSENVRASAGRMAAAQANEMTAMQQMLGQ